MTQAIFPLQICSLTLKYYLFGEVDENEILSSFFNFLPRNETELIKVFIKNEGDVQPISDILTEYSIFTLPTKENVKGLCVRAGRAALIRNPCFAMQRLITGMGKFWKSCTKSILDAVLMSAIPDSEKLINSLITTESTKQEGKIITWLHRFIRCCSQSELNRLLRFITGSQCLNPHKKIKVEFVDQSIPNLRPQSQTCFQILLISRQYTSFTQMTNNFNFFISNSDFWSVHDD